MMELSMPKLTGTRPEVISPTPPFARSRKYWIIMSLGRPVSSHMEMLPMGAITSRFFKVSRLTRTGENSSV